ncbi:MAG TPA: chromate transporter [Terriglobales bacterium]|jgi:chromate transporter|nr:chromate transporter [Terriglobales bacterium]
MNSERPSLPELALAFLKLGTIAFGGPAAHIAMMEEQFVRRRHWISHQEFLDRLAAANLIPGPSSTELAIYIGFQKRGWRGLVVAGCCFILPAAIILCCLAAVYVRFGSLPSVARVLYAVKPVVIAVVAQALWMLRKSAIRTAWLAMIAIACLLAYFLDVPPLLILLVAGIAALVVPLFRGGSTHSFIAWFATLLPASPTVADQIPFSIARLFLTFLKIGSVLFGSGYVLLVFLRDDFVTNLHWLNEHQLLDAVAVGQVTPGPVFTTATFIGYLVGGIKGAVVATIGIFLPGFFLVAMSGPLLPRIRRSTTASAFLDGVVAGSLALMIGVTWELGKAALVDIPTAIMAIASAVALIRFRINSAWLVLGAAVIGWVMNR